MLDEIKNKVCSIKERMVDFRRKLHRNPELSGQEEKTAAFVEGVLKDNGILDVRKGVGGWGVTGVVRGGNDGPAIALRADMDALPIGEKTGKEYSSAVPGVMHACGHDVHTAVLLGTAITLAGLRERLSGNVKFIFQPSEETGNGGAKKMIEDGALDNPCPSAIVALHCYPDYEAGTAGHKSGVITASSDRFTIGIKGKSGHAAKPHQTVDAILAASLAVNAIHHIVSRRIDPTENAVISIGQINGGTAPNIISEYVEIKGTVRAFEESVRSKMAPLIEQTVKGITESCGASYDFHYEAGCPSVVNDGVIDGLIRRCSIDVLGEKNTFEITKPQMGAEDFSYFTRKIPGALFRLGTGNAKKGINHPLHSSRFDVDEEALAVGATLMSWIAVKYLSENTP